MARESIETTESATDELQEVIYAVSHDLMGPVRHIRMFGQILEGQLGEVELGDVGECLTKIGEATDILQARLEALSDLSRVMTRGVDPEPCDAEGAVSEALLELEASIEQAGAVVTVDPLPVILADRQQFVAVVVELLTNSLKFGAANTEIRISATMHEADCEFAVADNGPGFRPRDTEVAFELFKRFHSGVIPGTGTGLAIVRRIVERHGGHVALRSVVGEGATVLFGLPLAEGGD